MSSLLIKPAPCLKGEVALLGDKSIAHRAVIISAITPARTCIENFPLNKDCLYTIRAFRELGIKITQQNTKRRRDSGLVTVFGKGLYGLKKPKRPIFVGDSGTTARIILGILAGQNFETVIRGGKFLSQRPMRRLTLPLRMMGAEINSSARKPEIQEEYLPIAICGGNLKAIVYKMPVASAQVKSAILLAGLYAEGLTQVIELTKSRDHTERMLKLFGADIKLKENKIVIKKLKRELISPGRIYIPADMSSASFFIVLATILPKSQLVIRSVGLNPSRTGVIRVLKRMRAKIRISASRRHRLSGNEPMGDLFVKSSSLKGTIVTRKEIPSLIDELPILMVAACYAQGKTIFEGIGELRVKETDRIRSMSSNLRKMGAEIKVMKKAGWEKMIIRGRGELRGNKVKSFGDHRTAMSMVVAGCKAKGKTSIDDIACINKSFPSFLTTLRKLI